jgi:hypothetical protein
MLQWVPRNSIVNRQISHADNKAPILFNPNGPTKRLAKKLWARRESNNSGAKALIRRAVYGPTKVVP